MYHFPLVFTKKKKKTHVTNKEKFQYVYRWSESYTYHYFQLIPHLVNLTKYITILIVAAQMGNIACEILLVTQYESSYWLDSCYSQILFGHFTTLYEPGVSTKSMDLAGS